MSMNRPEVHQAMADLVNSGCQTMADLRDNLVKRFGKAGDNNVLSDVVHLSRLGKVKAGHVADVFKQVNKWRASELRQAAAKPAPKGMIAPDLTSPASQGPIGYGARVKQLKDSIAKKATQATKARHVKDIVYDDFDMVILPDGRLKYRIVARVTMEGETA